MGNFECCVYCVPPKRHPGCQDTCGEYMESYENNQKILQAKCKEQAIRDYSYGARHRMLKKKGYNHHHAK